MIIRLKKPWNHGDKTYKSYDDGGGDLGGLPDSTANKLIEEGIGEDVSSEHPDVDPAPVKTIERAAETNPGRPQGADEPGQLGDALKRIAELETKLTKMASTPAGATKNALPDIRVVGENWTKDPKRGFNDAGDFYRSVRDAGAGPGGGKLLRWSKHVKAVGSDEYTAVEDSLGGFLIPPEFRTELLQKPMEAEFVRANGAVQIPTQSTMVSINAETDSNRQTTLFGGIQTYRLKERGQLTASKGEFEQIELKPKDLTGLAFVTDNLLFHSGTISAILGSQFQRAFMFKETKEFLKGDGAGEALGMINSSNPALYSQSRAASNLIDSADVIAMRSRCYDYGGAIWVTSASTLPQLFTLSITVGAGGAPVMLFNIATQDGIPTLLGRPVFFSEHAEALGTAGDLNLIVPNHYLIAETGRNVADTSIHLRFDYNETAFRFVKQMDAQPWWRSTLTLANGWETSPFITLAA